MIEVLRNEEKGKSGQPAKHGGMPVIPEHRRLRQEDLWEEPVSKNGIHTKD